MRDETGNVVVEAFAQDSASGLVHKLDVPAGERARLAWRWKADALVTGGDVARREGDDFVARVYVTFRYSPERLSPFQRARFVDGTAVWRGDLLRKLTQAGGQHLRQLQIGGRGRCDSDWGAVASIHIGPGVGG